jgi:hypothetical protein
MDEKKRKLKGSPSRDNFKRFHKELNKRFYATDLDLCLIEKDPPGAVAYVDFKGPNEKVTFSEAILYNELIKHAPLFIIRSASAIDGPFHIDRYLGGDWKPEPPRIRTAPILFAENWIELEKWEENLRKEYRKRGGWNNNFKTAEDF